MFFERLDYFSGNLREVIQNSPRLGDRLWAAMHTADCAFCIRYFGEQFKALDPSQKASWEPRLQLLLAICFYSEGNIEATKKLLNSIDQVRLKDTTESGWRDFYLSNFYHLALNLNNAKDALSTNQGGDGTALILGDSHTLTAGWCTHDDRTLRPCYLPGIRLEHLSDPKPNVFKKGIENALIVNSRCEEAFFVIGEIDYRIMNQRYFAGSRFATYEKLDALMEVQQAIAQQTMYFISGFKKPGQTYYFLSIQPPNPLLAKGVTQYAVDMTAEVSLIDAANKAIEEACNRHGVVFVNRRHQLSTAEGHLNAELLLDGKHLKRESYIKMLEALK